MHVPATSSGEPIRPRGIPDTIASPKFCNVCFITAKKAVRFLQRQGKIRRTLALKRSGSYGVEGDATGALATTHMSCHVMQTSFTGAICIGLQTGQNTILRNQVSCSIRGDSQGYLLTVY